MTDRLICPITGAEYCRICGNSAAHWAGCPASTVGSGTATPRNGERQHQASTAPLTEVLQ